MKLKNTTLITTANAILLVALITGCEMFNRTSHHKTSSVLQYLYPKENEHIDVPTIPVLSLPLKVGIAFVPEGRAGRNGDVYSSSGDSQFAEKQKMTLMKEVSDNFKKYPFVQSIELIPSAYIRPEGGFANVEQLRSMFGVDVIVLLSYDQVQFTDQGLLSLTYWTVAGAYLVRGEKNDTRTMMDAVVYDIQSHKMLFRAPGTSQVKASATPINLSEQLRHDSELGLQQSATNLVSNLQEQLELFKDRVKNSPEEYKIVTKPGYKGVGALTGWDLAFIAGLGVLFICSRKTKTA